MPELVFHLIRLGFLALLWLFVLMVVRAIRLDIFGPRVPRAARPAPPRATAAPTASKPKPRALPRQLVITQGDLAGTTVALAEAPVTIGRDPSSTLVLTDDYVSSHHARLMPRDGQWILEDLGSTNGTYLGKVKVSGPTPVQAGGTVRIGKTVLELRR
ncbi:MAG TPA: FHA domain-containing protein [Mycobacteriales bacterium]|nr:FHA domain-containing protein [Mycobacteriales bacterium]